MSSHVTIFQFNPTCRVELIEYIFEISLKTQLFGASSNCSVIMWHITWLPLFTLSIFLPVQLVVLLSWADYNFKSFKPNKSASLFKRRSSYLFNAANIAGPCICQRFCRNPLSTGKDELAGIALGAPTNSSNTSTLTPAVSYAFIPVGSRTPTLAFALALSSNNELFKQFIKAYLRARLSPPY